MRIVFYGRAVRVGLEQQLARIIKALRGSWRGADGCAPLSRPRPRVEESAI
jgi:hypothetical protein